MPKVSDEHRAARREQILAAASRCVAQEGFHKTTMAHVIAESGLSAGAVYGYFKGKNEIIRAIADHAVGGLAGSLQQLAEQDDPVQPVDALEVVLGHVTVLAEGSDVDFTRVAVQAWAEACRDPDVHEIVRLRLLTLREVWEAVVLRAQKDGTVDAGADASLVAQTMIGLMPGFVLQRLILGDITAASYVAGFRGLTGNFPSAVDASPGS